MFKFLVNLVESYSSKYDDLEIEEVNNLNEIKLSIVLMKSESKMGSIELLADGTCDFLIIDYESENLLFSKTIKVNDLDSLQDETFNFLELLIK